MGARDLGSASHLKHVVGPLWASGKMAQIPFLSGPSHESCEGQMGIWAWKPLGRRCRGWTEAAGSAGNGASN